VGGGCGEGATVALAWLFGSVSGLDLGSEA